MTLRRFLKRLRLKNGDILLMRRTQNSYRDIEKIVQAARIAGLDVDCPIVVVDNFRDIKVKRHE